MVSDRIQDTPLGILLISIFWILMAILFLILSSLFRGSSITVLFFIFLGTFFIFLGWGLLTLNKWAYYISLATSLLGLVLLLGPMIYTILYIIEAVIRGYFNLFNIFPFSIGFLFIPTVWYLLKNKSLFVKK